MTRIVSLDEGQAARRGLTPPTQAATKLSFRPFAASSSFLPTSARIAATVPMMLARRMKA